MEKSKPKFKIGDKIVILPFEIKFYYKIDGELKYPVELLDEYNYDIITDFNWYPYSNHPNGGYWQYTLAEKANSCPEDFLALYDVNAIYYNKPEFIK